MSGQEIRIQQITERGKFSASNIPFLVGMFIAVIALIVMTILYVTCLAERVDPSDCNKSKEQFAVKPQSFIEPLKICGSSGVDQCQFTVANLLAAVNKCNSDSKCDSFMFSVGPTTSQMWYIDPTVQSKPQTGSDIYINQLT